MIFCILDDEEGAVFLGYKCGKGRQRWCVGNAGR